MIKIVWIRHCIAELLVKLANRISPIPHINSSIYTHVDNINYFEKSFLNAMEEDGLIQGFKHMCEIDEKAEEMRKLHGGFVVIEGDNITITNNPTDIF